MEYRAHGIPWDTFHCFPLGQNLMVSYGFFPWNPMGFFCKGIIIKMITKERIRLYIMALCQIDYMNI